MRTSNLFFAMAGVLFLAVPSLAQQTTTRVVAVETNLDSAVLYADSVRIGVVTGTYLKVPAGARRLQLVPPAQGLWGTSPVTAVLDGEMDSVGVRMMFKYHHQLETSPHGANVILELDNGEPRRIGRSPVLHVESDLVEGTFRVELDGYVTETARLGSEVWNRYQIPLRKLDSSETVSADVYWKPPRKRRRWIDYTALGAAAAGGLLAVHFKFKADRRFEEYQETGDPDLRPGVKRYDVYSGVSLGVMQAGIGVFAIRLVLK